MGVTSLIQNAVQTPHALKFDKKSITNSNVHSNLISILGSSRNSYASELSHSPFLRLRSVRNFSRTHFFPLAYVKRTEEEDGVSTVSEWDGSSMQSFNGSSTPSYDESSEVGKPHESSSSGSSLKEKHGPESYKSSVRTVALCVCSAVAFGVGLGFKDGVSKASEFFAGYLLEQSLSVDNLFVFVLIFKYFKVPLMYQNRVLSYGIAGAVVFRLSLILLGTATLQRFEVVNLLLAAILLYSSIKLLGVEEEEEDLSDNFIVKTCQKFIPVIASYDGNRFFTMENGVWKATPLLLTVAVIELSDIAFAVDSIPAVFGVTRDPFIVFTSNFFAILGLRSLYTLISESMAELEYLQGPQNVLIAVWAIMLEPAIAVVLGFIGFKMILDFFGYHVGTEISLGFVATSLTAGVLLSLMKKSD